MNSTPVTVPCTSSTTATGACAAAGLVRPAKTTTAANMLFIPETSLFGSRNQQNGDRQALFARFCRAHSPSIRNPRRSWCDCLRLRRRRLRCWDGQRPAGGRGGLPAELAVALLAPPGGSIVFGALAHPPLRRSF